MTPAEVESAAARTGYSRFPVRGEEDDRTLIGYLHLKDALEIKDRPPQPADRARLDPPAARGER